MHGHTALLVLFLPSPSRTGVACRAGKELQTPILQTPENCKKIAKNI